MTGLMMHCIIAVVVLFFLAATYIRFSIKERSKLKEIIRELEREKAARREFLFREAEINKDADAIKETIDANKNNTGAARSRAALDLLRNATERGTRRTD